MRVRPGAAVAVCLCLLCAGCGAGYVTSTPSTPAPPDGAASTPAPPTPPTGGGAGTPATPTPVSTTAPDPTPTEASTPTAIPSTLTPTPTPTPATQGAIRVVNDSGGNATLPVNATLVYERTARLLATDARRPDAVVVRDIEAPASGSPPAFFRLWGMTRPADDRELTIAAYVRDPDRVILNGDLDAPPGTVETTLAHEYVHVVQFRQGVFAAVRRPAVGPDARATATAVTEGAAVFAADAYWRRHLSDRSRGGDRPGPAIRRLYANASGVARWTAAPYRFGYRYVRERAGDPSSLATVYRDPPTTTEQVLHPEVEEGPVGLEPRVTGGEAWEYAGTDRRMGELFVRVALATALSDRRAAAAADGWGDDARLGFVNGTGARGYAWVLRFDDAANATEFDGALRAYLSARNATREGDVRSVEGHAFRATRVDARTVVVFAGAPGFVRNATARADGDRVAVAGPGAGE